MRLKEFTKTFKFRYGTRELFLRTILYDDHLYLYQYQIGELYSMGFPGSPLEVEIYSGDLIAVAKVQGDFDMEKGLIIGSKQGIQTLYNYVTTRKFKITKSTQIRLGKYRGQKAKCTFVDSSSVLYNLLF